ncbi:hypothetical protein Daus18300_011917 [Diaporthe australafricana]|uniref:Integral membrane protein n=1 Tax=Diaporthe australafricana TaxID=127596 RepID=A0ABR3W4T1_9PEZI
MGGDGISSRPENTDISSKPRRRRNDGYFWQLIILRIPLAVFAVVIIAYLVHYMQKWQGAIRRPEDADDPNVTRKDAQGQSGLALGMASVSLVVALWETLARVAPRKQFWPKPLGPVTIFFDLVVIGLGVPGWLFFLMAEYNTDPSYPTPWGYDQDRAAMMVIVFWVFHCVTCITGCSACCGCCCFASTTPEQKEKATQIHPAQIQDLEQGGIDDALPNYKQSTGLEEIELDATPVDPPSYPEAVRLHPHTND